MAIKFTNLLWRHYDINQVSGGVSPQVKVIEAGFKPNLSWILPENSACVKVEKKQILCKVTT